eukprot:350494-Chlamydomonas_euryale.AAC.2
MDAWCQGSARQTGFEKWNVTRQLHPAHAAQTARVQRANEQCVRRHVKRPSDAALPVCALYSAARIQERLNHLGIPLGGCLCERLPTAAVGRSRMIRHAQQQLHQVRAPAPGRAHQRLALLAVGFCWVVSHAQQQPRHVCVAVLDSIDQRVTGSAVGMGRVVRRVKQ